MTPEPLRDTISYLIIQVAKAHRNLAAELLIQHGLYPGQELVLMHVWQCDGIVHSELAHRLKVEPPTLSKMLNRLEKIGLLERRRDEQDARLCRVYLTDCGWALQEPVMHYWQTLEEATLSTFSLEEKVLLKRFLLQLCTNLEQP